MYNQRRHSVRIVGALRARASWARVARELALALIQIGARVSLVEDDDGLIEPNLSLRPEVLAAITAGDSPADIDLLITPPSRFARYKRSPFVAAMMVAEVHTWPKEWLAEASQHLDVVVVPSSFCERSIVASGARHDRIAVVPHGFDPDIYRPVNHGRQTGERLRILFVGTPSYRKGLPILLCALSSLDNYILGKLHLTVKTELWPSEKHQIPDTRNAVNGLTQRGLSVILQNDYLSDDKMAALYKTHDFLCAPHCGEGFGITLLEAMACGLPVMSILETGPGDFFSAECGWILPAKPVAVASSFLPSNFYGDSDEVIFGPTENDIAHTIVQILSAPKQINSKSSNAVSRVKHLTWEHAALVFCSALRQRVAH